VGVEDHSRKSGAIHERKLTPGLRHERDVAILCEAKLLEAQSMCLDIVFFMPLTFSFALVSVARCSEPFISIH